MINLLILFLTCLLGTRNLVQAHKLDPESIVGHCVNVSNGQYCETAIDLKIIGPDTFTLKRNYSDNRWKLFSSYYLTIGKDAKNNQVSYGYTCSESGEILTFTDRKDKDESTSEYLKNYENGSYLEYKDQICEILSKDGSTRIYERTSTLSSLVFDKELNELFKDRIVNPEYFRLKHQILPSGNHILYSYDSEGQLTLIEMKNSLKNKTLLWLKFSYEPVHSGYIIKLRSSDEKYIEYHFDMISSGNFMLVKVLGSHLIPCSYEYYTENSMCYLIKKLQEKHVIEISYKEGKVSKIKDAHHTLYSFHYNKGYTYVYDAAQIKTVYYFNDNLQLGAIEKYDAKRKLYRVDKKFWGNSGRLAARSISDRNGKVQYYCSYKYDSSDNIIEEKLYGNLTGKKEAAYPSVDANGVLVNEDQCEYYITNTCYSANGFSYPIKIGNKEVETQYFYQPGTNLCIKELVLEKKIIKKRKFYFYNDDGSCIKTVEDDGSNSDETKLTGVTERQIKLFTPKTILPNVGLPEIIEEKIFDPFSNKEILVKKFTNSFDSQGNLISCSTYDAEGNFAYCEKRSYNCLGQILSETNRIGQEIFHTYDVVGNRLSTHSPYENKLIQFTYNSHNLPILINENIGEFRFTEENTFDIKGNKTASTDKFGNTTHYEYDEFGRLLNVIFPKVFDEKEIISQPTFCYEYDIFGNVISIKDPKGDITLKTYNVRGHPTIIIYPDGTIEKFKYDLSGNLHRAMSRDRIISTFSYDFSGRIIYIEKQGIDNQDSLCHIHSLRHKYNGFRIVETEENGLITKYKYDPSRRMTVIACYASGQSENDPETRQTELYYDGFGRIIYKKTVCDTCGNGFFVEKYEYDLFGNIISEHIEDAFGNVQLKKGYEYDLNNRCTAEFCGNEVKRISYNAFGEPILFSDALNNETKISIDYSFTNILGQNVVRKTITNAIGTSTEIEFDCLERIVTISKRDQAGTLISNQKILFDSCGNKCSEIHDIIFDSKVIGKKELKWVYGPMGRLDQEIDSNGLQTFLSYNTAGQLISKRIAGLENPITFTYYSGGYLKSVEHKNDQSPDAQIANFYKYNYKGYLIEARDKQYGTQVDRTYNAFNEMISEKITYGSGEGSSIVKNSYDQLGRIKNVILPDNSSIQYSYSGLFCNKVKRISSNSKELYSHSYDSYDDCGKITKETLPGSSGKITHQYDLNQKEIKLITSQFTEFYTYDGLSRLIAVERSGDCHEKKSIFEYNDLSQLITENGQNTGKYIFDSLNKRVNINGEQLIYNARDQLQKYSKTQCSYDHQGNLLRKMIDHQETIFEINAFSELIKVKKNNQTILFSIDPLGRRLTKKNIDPKTKKSLSKHYYIYLGNQEIGSLNEKKTICDLRVPGIEGHSLSLKSISFEIDGKPYAVLHNTIGNVIALQDIDSGKIVESYSYSAFGKESIFDSSGEQIQISAIKNPWRYAEKRIDEETGLIFFGIRYYDPEAGYWISPDPLGSIDGPNPYAYLQNNPLNNFDRFGLETESSSSKSGHFFYGETERWYSCNGDYCLSKTWTRVDKGVLPKISYNHDFENMYPDYPKSSLYDLGLEDNPDIGIGYINGIMNQFKESFSTADYISKLAGGRNVKGVYNATHGFFIDLYECFMGIQFIATDPVKHLHTMWNSFFEKASEKSKFLMICHSQGVLHVRNALLDYSEDLRKRILVVAIAPAGYIYKQTCAKVVHYRAEGHRDFITRIDMVGAEREKDNVIDLKSHLKAGFLDHSIKSPTYQDVLSRRIRLYLETQGQSI